VGTACSAYGPSQAGDAADLAASFAPPPEALAGRAVTTTTLILRADGERLWREVAFRPLRGPDDGLLGLLGQVYEPEERPLEAPSRSHGLRVRLLALRQSLHQRFGFDSLIGVGPAHRRLLEQVKVASTTAASVLIVGEPGTGKRHVARVIHQLGARPDAPLMSFDCRALPAEVLERELFVATEADAPARLAAAGGATLILGDVLELPRDVQSRLVEALDGRVRLIGVTSGDPEAAVHSDRLRADFYFAASILTIRLLPLRERRDEILLLAQHFLERANRRGGPQRSGFTPAAESALAAYDWPGNLRELARVVDHAHASGTASGASAVPNAPVDVDDLPADVRGELGAGYLPPRTTQPRPLDEILTDVERRLIENAMAKARRNKSRAAEILGVSRPRLYRRIKELNLPDENESNEA
jgi:DNA-binding NtrC family response regulator